MHIGTFHSLCLDFLKKQGKEFFIADPSALSETARERCKEYGLSITPSQFLTKFLYRRQEHFLMRSRNYGKNSWKYIRKD